MNYGLHINHNPAGNFSFVGTIPVTLMATRKPTRSDVMGGRVDFATGLAYYAPVYKTVAEAMDAAVAAGLKDMVCKNPKCACSSPKT
jgi:hypothetical protein